MNEQYSPWYTFILNIDKTHLNEQIVDSIITNSIRRFFDKTNWGTHGLEINRYVRIYWIEDRHLYYWPSIKTMNSFRNISAVHQDSKMSKCQGRTVTLVIVETSMSNEKVHEDMLITKSFYEILYMLRNLHM